MPSEKGAEHSNPPGERAVTLLALWVGTEFGGDGTAETSLPSTLPPVVVVVVSTSGSPGPKETGCNKIFRVRGGIQDQRSSCGKGQPES